MNFRDLSEQQILALAISAEEEDSRIYADFAESLRSGYPAQPSCSWRWPRRSPDTGTG